MNTANLQLEGLLVALTHVFGALRAKGLLTPQDLEQALREAEASAIGHADRNGQLREANQNAILFPIRYLIEATSGSADGKAFRDITADVAREKDDTGAAR